jgi:hypothetical protein
MLGTTKYNLRGISNVRTLYDILEVSATIRNGASRSTVWALTRLVQEFRRFRCSTIIIHLTGGLLIAELKVLLTVHHSISV